MCENQPVSAMSTQSPGESVFTSAASAPPLPDDGKMTTGPVVPKTGLRPSAAPSVARAANWGPRWSMTGRSIARRTRSGTLLGAGDVGESDGRYGSCPVIVESGLRAAGCGLRAAGCGLQGYGLRATGYGLHRGASQMCGGSKCDDWWTAVRWHRWPPTGFT